MIYPILCRLHQFRNWRPR